MEFPTVKKDFLTGFYIKEDMEAILNKVRSECKISQKPFSVLVMDLDHFKSYNYKYGHLDGDALLKYFASTIRISLEGEDSIPLRFGGDEFIIIFPEKRESEAYAIAAQLAKVFSRRPFLTGNRLCRVSFSGGIASYPKDGDNIKILIAKADRAMYFAKLCGRGKTARHSMIWFLLLKRAIFIVIIAGFFVFAIYNRACLSKNYIFSSLKSAKEWIMKIPAASFSDLIYLKSGGKLKGRIVKYDQDFVVMKLGANEAEVMIRQDEINKIIKGN